jgi:hypothetical protein
LQNQLKVVGDIRKDEHIFQECRPKAIPREFYCPERGSMSYAEDYCVHSWQSSASSSLIVQQEAGGGAKAAGDSQ